jgi:hypothetical protein
MKESETVWTNQRCKSLPSFHLLIVNKMAFKHLRCEPLRLSLYPLIRKKLLIKFLEASLLLSHFILWLTQSLACSPSIFREENGLKESTL